jgi:hypothetical protein
VSTIPLIGVIVGLAALDLVLLAMLATPGRSLTRSSK